MSWIQESYQRGKKMKDSYSLNGIPIYIKDRMVNDIDMEFVIRYITSRIPAILMKGVDVIYVGNFKHLELRDINAMYEDGAIYLTNHQDDEMDIIDDIIHEIAHACEKEYLPMIYDGAIEQEFIAKRKRLYSVLKAEGYDVSPVFRIKIDHDEQIDRFLYKDVGYVTLNNLVNGLFPSPYSATSLREYFATCFEEYFMGDVSYLKSISPVAYRVITQLSEMED